MEVKKNEEDEDAKEEEQPEEEEEEDLFTTVEKLNLLLTYIRLEHFYCLYCGISYENQEDMDQNCPGISRDDHDD